MIEREIKLFGEHLREMRMKSGKTVRRLAEEAEVSFALLTCIENARRGAGRSTLERLGAALGLKERELDDFILDGMVICKRERLLGAAEGYPARVLNALPSALRWMGVLPEDVQACEPVQQADWKRTSSPMRAADFVVHLKDGSKVNVSFKISND